MSAVAGFDFGLRGLVFVITGGAAGIGRATAQMAATQGARVVITDLPDSGGKELAEELVSSGAEAEFFPCDVADEGSIRELAAHLEASYGVVDVLHNNAGITDAVIRDDLSLEAMTEADWDRIQQVNVRGPIMLAKHTLPLLRRSRTASIVNAASAAALVAHQRTLAYGTSKTAMVGLTRNLAVELARDGIRVNCYCPGVIETEMLTRYIARQDDPTAFRRALVAENLVPRLGTPEEVAAVVCFLASPVSSFVNGAVWSVDGGSTMWRGVADWDTDDDQ